MEVLALGVVSVLEPCPLGACSSLEMHPSGHIPVLPSPLAGRAVTAAAWAPDGHLGDVLWLQHFIVTTAQREWQQRLGVGYVKYGSVGCVIFHRPLSLDAFAEGTVDGVKVVQIPESDHSVNPGQNMRPMEGVGCRLVRVADEKRRLLKVTFVPDSIPGTGSGSLTQITLVYSSVFIISYILSECAPHTNIYVCYQRDVRASAETDGD